jgi:hypothetical protein
MNKLHHILAALAVTSASVLSAQTSDETSPRGPHGRGHRGSGGPGGHGHPIVRALDADKNGEISATEINGAPAALAKLDTNADGAVAVDELRPARPAGPAARPEGAPARPDHATKREAMRSRHVDVVMLALDADSDGALSAAEIARSVASLGALDANSDGKLTRDELHPLPPASK